MASLFKARWKQAGCYLLPPQRPLWRPAVKSRAESAVPLEQRPYYLRFEDRLSEEHFDHFDQEGIPTRRLGGCPVRNYTTVCAYALALWNRHLDGDGELAPVLHVARWLTRRQAQDGAWYYAYDGPFGLKAPWVSAMAQGEALSLLARVYAASGEAAFHDSAERGRACPRRRGNSGGRLTPVPQGVLTAREELAGHVEEVEERIVAPPPA